MSIRISRVVFVTALGVSATLAALTAGEAHAALGGSPMTPPSGASSVSRVVEPAAQSSSQAVLKSGSAAASSSSTSSSTASYTVRETTFGNGTVVREYLAQDGTVFGIAWQGPQMPDLDSLLGTYFSQYVVGVKAARARTGRGPVAVDQSGLVVRSGGHMGAFAGQAWLPQSLPGGVSGSDIQ